MNKELDNAVNYFKNRNSFERPVYETTQFQTILKALTPPTAEEVCEALGKHYKLEGFGSVRFDVSCFGFFYFEECIVQKTYDDNVVLGMHDLPPHLITLIGRFYESVVK